MRRLHAYLSIAALSLCSIACESRPSSGGTASSSAASSASAVASAAEDTSPMWSPVELPAGDPAIVERLAALANCERVARARDCVELRAWKLHIAAVDTTDGDTPSGKAERARQATSCLASLGHASAIVREAAAECVSDYQAELADRKLATRAVLAQLRSDTSEAPRRPLLRALSALDPTEHGLAREVVALAKPLLGKRAARRYLEGLVDALSTSNFRLRLPRAPDAIAFALELVRRREAEREAITVLAEVDAPSNEVCAALLELAETKRGAWSDAIVALLSDSERCEAQRERAVQVLLDIAKQPRGPTKDHAFSAVANRLASAVDEAVLSADQKARLRAAAESALPSAIEPRERESLEELRDALKGE
jgi:hypothetical protein